MSFFFQAHVAFRNFTAEKYGVFCHPSLDIPWLNGSVVAVMRGNCTFSEKALLAQQHGARAVVIVSKDLVSQSYAPRFFHTNFVRAILFHASFHLCT